MKKINFTLSKNFGIKFSQLCLLLTAIINIATIYMVLFNDCCGKKPVPLSVILATTYASAKLDLSPVFIVVIYPILLTIMCLTILIVTRREAKNKTLFALPGVITIFVLLWGNIFWQGDTFQLFSVLYLLWPMYYGFKKETTKGIDKKPN